MLLRGFGIHFLCLAAAAIARLAAAKDTEAETFFEEKIRPILATRCEECHGSRKQQAGLRVDSRVSLLQGGDSGPALLVDHPQESLLLRVISYRNDIKMPPQQQLSDDEIELLTQWVRGGAVFPVENKPQAPALGFAATPEGLTQARKTHWAYQPIRYAVPLETINHDWLKTPIDGFILTGLHSAGLTHNPAADRRTLLRRLTFDLIGLPLSLDDLHDFETDASPDAWERVIDRLLASPHYGERWGRHWLDIARYADTKGYVGLEERKYPYSYTYRDYVVDAFNRDLPYDQFVLEQIAADQLGGEKASLRAMGFLTVGRRFGNKDSEIIDDRIDVVSRGLLGLTVSCARCHDHKYDAVPTEDYYSLYGIFASSLEPEELPKLGEPVPTEAYRLYAEERQRRLMVIEEFLLSATAELRNEFRSKSDEYLRAAALADPPRDLDVKSQVVRRWKDYLARTSNETHSVFGPWHMLMQLPVEGFAAGASMVISRLDDSVESPSRANTQVKQKLQGTALSTKEDVVRIYGELLVGVQQEWIKLRASGATALPDSAREELRQVLYAEDGPIPIKEDELRKLLGRKERYKLTVLKGTVEAHEAIAPGAPPRAMVLNDAPQPTEPHVFVRGNSRRPGKQVPRQFLRVLQPNPKPFQQGSGRLELARAIVDPQNPLTGRVIVNRVWQQHFGKGLVRTSSDFGVRGEAPSHPELLDWLASGLRDHGWSLKWLHRTVLSSATYQQSSDDRAEALPRDPDNRWLWKMNRRRLEFEPIRDSLFAVADQLDDRIGGQPVDLFAQPFFGRRAVYGLIDRQNLPGTFRVFDFASPDVSTAQRTETTVPQQLLYHMNSVLVTQQSQRLAQLAGAAGGDQALAIQRLYQWVFARQATEEELSAALSYLTTGDTRNDDSTIGLTPLEQLAQALLLTNEFVFVD